jgi:TfoX/Sxy family transcriptional regulator of competence genes
MKFEKSSDDMARLFSDLLRRLKDIEQRKAFGHHTCFISGNMFIGLNGNSFFLRLDEDGRSDFQKISQARLLVKKRYFNTARAGSTV